MSFLSEYSVAQTAFGYSQEAYLFSQNQMLGTARMQALGGAMVSLGADAGSAIVNPAGLGMFNRSSLIISPAVFADVNTIDYFGTNSGNVQVSPHINSFALNFHNDGTGKGPFKGGTFTISFQRLNTFSRNVDYTGADPESYIIDNFIDFANGTSINNLGGLSELAFNTFLIEPATDENGNIINGQYTSFIPDFPNRQTDRTRYRGRQNQWNFAYGANFNDKLYVGAGLGVRGLQYRVDRTYSENFSNASQLNGIVLNEVLDLGGTGVNGNIGIIYRVTPGVRLGGSITTPTFTRISERNFADLTVSYRNVSYTDPLDGETYILGNEFDETPEFVSQYSLISPLRINMGGTFFIKKSGFITADVEFIDFSSARYQTNDFTVSDINDEIMGLFGSVVNLRIGGEYRYNVFRLRAGTNYMTNAYSERDFGDLSRLSFSAGGGIALPTFFADFAVVSSSFESRFNPYQLTSIGSPAATIQNRLTNVVMTIGFNF
jgi:hypothetical protein